MCFIECGDPTQTQSYSIVVFNDDSDDESSNSDMDDDSSLSIETDSENDEIKYDNDESVEFDVVEDFVAACSEKYTNHPPDLFVTNNQFIGGLTFHPKTNIIALGLSNGDISIYKYSNEKNEYLKTYNDSHLTYVSQIRFNETGDKIFSVCLNKDVSVTNAETGQLDMIFNEAHLDESNVNALSVINENSFATGDDNGYVKIWDLRVNGCKFSLKTNDYGINSILTLDKNNRQPTIVCTADDGVLNIIDVLNHQMMLQTDHYNSPLNNCVSLKQNTKLVSGTDGGTLISFNSEDYSLLKDQFLHFGIPITRLIQMTEDIVLCGLNDGQIRASSMFPHCHLGIVGQQEYKPIYCMDKSNTGHLIASSHQRGKYAKFWNIEFLENYDVQKHIEKTNQNE